MGVSNGYVVVVMLVICRCVEVDGSELGVNWGRNASHPLPATTVVELLKSNNVSSIRLFEADPSVLQSLSGTGIDVVLGIPNSMLPHLNSSLKLATTWVHDYIARYFPRLRLQYIAVGDEPFLQAHGTQYTPYVMGAVTNIQTALTRANLADHVKVVVPCSYDSFGLDSGLPSKGHFRSDLNNTMLQLLTFLSKHNSPFLSSISPFHLLQLNTNISLRFSLFSESSHHKSNTHKPYNNSFDLSYDTLVAALSNAGFPETEIIISQVGWPTDGAVNANSSIAQTFMKGLLSHLRGKLGTPLRPHNPPKKVYIFSLLDEDQRMITDGDFERHWGIFTFDGQAKYHIDLGQGSTSLVNAKNVDYLSARWCVVNNNKDISNASALALEACSTADCSALSPGASCHNLTWPGNISYAFNSYYQQHDQNPDSCDFNGLGLVTTVDPSVDSCRFVVQLRTSYASFIQAPSSVRVFLFWIVVIMLI